MSTINDDITDVIRREGGAKVTNDPVDKGGRTQYGIAEASNPEAWLDGKVTEEEARGIYLQKYVIAPGFHLIPPSHSKVQAQLIDFGVNSGPMIAIQKLQFVLGLKQDFVFGPKTLAALVNSDPKDSNNRLVRERVKMLVNIVVKNPTQLKNVNGWVARALDFLA